MLQAVSPGPRLPVWPQWPQWLHYGVSWGLNGPSGPSGPSGPRYLCGALNGTLCVASNGPSGPRGPRGAGITLGSSSEEDPKRGTSACALLKHQ